MAINTTNKNLYRPDNNTFVNTWDEPVNTNTTGIDYALGGVCYVSMNGRSGAVLMIGTYAATSPYLPDNVGSAGSPVLAPNSPSYIPFNIIASDALNATTTLTLPAGVCGQWSIFNDTTQAVGVKLYFGVTGETPLEIPNGTRILLVSDGINVTYAQSPQIIPTTNQTPIGGIILWYGTIANIPTGWHLCNGDTVTLDGIGSVVLPDLRDKFVIGASQDSSGIAKTNITGSLTITGGDKDSYLITHDHALTDPGHHHSYDWVTSAGVSAGGSATVADDNRLGQQTGDSYTGITMATAGTVANGTNRNLPPYYALAYIIRIS